MSSAAAVRILYVRHGQNLANVHHQLSHKVVDHPLTDHGRDQAEQLARGLADQDWRFDDEIVSSPSRRAQETAQVIAAKLDLTIVTDERLREIDVGALDGRSDREAWDAYAEIHRRWAAGEWSRRFPDGENLRNLANRLRAALLSAATTAALRPATQGGRDTPIVLVVGHGGGFRGGPSVPRQECRGCLPARRHGQLCRDVPAGDTGVPTVGDSSGGVGSSVRGVPPTPGLRPGPRTRMTPDRRSARPPPMRGPSTG